LLRNCQEKPSTRLASDFFFLTFAAFLPTKTLVLQKFLSSN